MACALPMKPPPIMATFITLVIVFLRQMKGGPWPDLFGKARGPSRAGGANAARKKVSGDGTGLLSEAGFHIGRRFGIVDGLPSLDQCFLGDGKRRQRHKRRGFFAEQTVTCQHRLGHAL